MCVRDDAPPSKDLICISLILADEAYEDSVGGDSIPGGGEDDDALLALALAAAAAAATVDVRVSEGDSPKADKDGGYRIAP